MGCDDEVAGEGDLETATEGHALDRRDEGLSAVASDHPVFASSIGDVVAPGRQVAPGAEHRSGAGQHPRPELVVVIELVQCVVDGVGKGPVDGVALGLPPHRDDEHPSTTAGLDETTHDHDPARCC